MPFPGEFTALRNTPTRALGRSEVLSGHRQSLPERDLWGSCKSHGRLWETGSQKGQRENKSLLDLKNANKQQVTITVRIYTPRSHSLTVRVSGLDCGPLLLQGFRIINHLYVQTMEIFPFPTRFFRLKTDATSKS